MISLVGFILLQFAWVFSAQADLVKTNKEDSKGRLSQQRELVPLLPDSEFLLHNPDRREEYLAEAQKIYEIMEKYREQSKTTPRDSFSAKVLFDGNQFELSLSRLKSQEGFIYPFNFTGTLTKKNEVWEFPERRPSPGLGYYIQRGAGHRQTGRNWIELDLKYFDKGKLSPDFKRAAFEIPFLEKDGWQGNFKFYDSKTKRWIDSSGAWRIR